MSFVEPAARTRQRSGDQAIEPAQEAFERGIVQLAYGELRLPGLAKNPVREWVDLAIDDFRCRVSVFRMACDERHGFREGVQVSKSASAGSSSILTKR